MPIDLALAPLTKAADNPTAAEATARWRAALQRASENTTQQQRRRRPMRTERDATFSSQSETVCYCRRSISS